MSEINLLADKIEQAINKSFEYFAEQKLGMYNYALLFNPKKYEYWIVVLFFEDKVQLKNSLNNGFCYSVHQFLRNEIVQIDKQLPIVIVFEAGEYPSNKIEYEQLFEKHILTLGKNIATCETLETEKGKQKICSICGHNSDKHKFHRIGNVLEGWITCPEEDCFCFGTWDTPITKKDK